MPEWVSEVLPWLVGFVIVGGAIFSVGNWYGSVNSDRRSFKTFMDKVGSDLDDIRANIQNIFHLLPRPVVESNSPVQLTDFGREIAKKVFAEEWAAQQAPILADDAKGKPEFEVFDLCVGHVEKMYKENDSFNANVRKGAYECGTSTTDVMKVYHVVLRDAVLKLLAAQ